MTLRLLFSSLCSFLLTYSAADQEETSAPRKPEEGAAGSCNSNEGEKTMLQANGDVSKDSMFASSIGRVTADA